MVSIGSAKESNEQRLWEGKWAEDRRAAKMSRKDLEASRTVWVNEAVSDDERHERENSDCLAYVDHAGRYFDFHALRHQFITMLAKNGVHPRVAQDLARHASIELTIRAYSHLDLYDLGSAIESLPGLPGKNTESPLRKTGTCDDTPIQKPQTPESEGGFGIVER